MQFKLLNYLVLICILLSISFTVQASKRKEAIGSLRNVSGLATITRTMDDGKKKIFQARNGLPVYQKDMIKTTQGILGIIFNDNTRISLAKNSLLVLTKYVYTPAKKEYGMITRVMRGKVAVFTGEMSNLKANSIIFKTPNATIGSRGTSFLIEVNDGGFF